MNNNFTLKLKYDKYLRIYEPNDEHHYGGMDIKQRVAFTHICPIGFFYEFESDIYFALIESHGWDYEINKDG